MNARSPRSKEPGTCGCTRPQNRQHRDGTWFKTCTHCAAANLRYERIRRERQERNADIEEEEAAPPPASKVRVVRLSSTETRLATLLECRQAWLDCRTVGAYSRWLIEQISGNGRRNAAEAAE